MKWINGTHWSLSHAIRTIFHDGIAHPICGILWAAQMPPLSRLADRLHMWTA